MYPLPYIPTRQEYINFQYALEKIVKDRKISVLRVAWEDGVLFDDFHEFYRNHYLGFYSNHDSLDYLEELTTEEIIETFETFVIDEGKSDETLLQRFIKQNLDTAKHWIYIENTAGWVMERYLHKITVTIPPTDYEDWKVSLISLDIYYPTDIPDDDRFFGTKEECLKYLRKWVERLIYSEKQEARELRYKKWKKVPPKLYFALRNIGIFKRVYQYIEKRQPSTSIPPAVKFQSDGDKAKVEKFIADLDSREWFIPEHKAKPRVKRK